MDSDGNSKDDVKVPDGDIGKEIETGFEDGKDMMVTIISAMGELSYYITIPNFVSAPSWSRIADE